MEILLGRKDPEIQHIIEVNFTDEYQLERYRNVAIEAVAVFAEAECICPPRRPTHRCFDHDLSKDCRQCWREALERER